MDLFNAETYKKRREKLKKKIGKGRLFFPGNDHSSINFKDNWYPFRQDSTFLYYFGLDLPGLNAVIDIDEDREIIFGDELSIDDIIWTGPLPTLQSQAEKVGIHMVLPKVEMIQYAGDQLHYLPPYRPEHTILLGKLLHKKPGKVRKKYSQDFVEAVVRQRSNKSAAEIIEIEKAVTITNKMHIEVMRYARPGMMEHELVGIASRVAHDHNVQFSFPPILTVDGQTLHNHYHGNELKRGDMVLFDGGCESPSHYAGDITRTFPVADKFTGQQNQMYSIVHEAYTRAIGKLQPGVKFLDVHLTASKALIEGLTSMGIMKGDSEEAVMAGAHTLFFQCGLGHMMGLDVHDMENLGEENVGYSKHVKKSKEFGLKSLRLGRVLKEGFVLTVEPGIYIIPELIDLRQSQGLYTDFVDYEELNKFRNFGGIRLEDDFVITRNGSHLLGIEMPTTAEEIEEIRYQ